jgi:hypothetical protein
MTRAHQLLVWCAATDATFEPVEVDGKTALAGKCIHCGRALVVDLQARGRGGATVEHIVPKTHGGTDALENLAVACARCNQGKGKRLDWRRGGDPTLERVIETLKTRRLERMRAPPPSLGLPPEPPTRGRQRQRSPSGPDDEERQGTKGRRRGRGRGRSKGR